MALFAAAPPAPRGEIPDFIAGAEGLEDALRNLKASLVKTPVLTPEEQRKGFRLRDGYQVQLLAAEPIVKQPLHLAFDPRGRLWVTQYRQYPFPAGLKVIAYDRYIRAKFDKLPPPPPHHFKGEDRITLHEDSRGDGTFAKVSTFVDGLNIATACLPDREGVWVLNPPYLLFYPTKDDVPGTPVVHLSGFGLEDTHAVASSLTWGPDGWIYGAQGSTCTAKVRVEKTKARETTDFLGQAIWRYHPTQHRFEIYAEGGGNTFGVAFNEQGDVFSGTNWGRYRGLHYVQGGYHVKGWGKHGPLTNPYALGYFEHMHHVGDADRLVHTFEIYHDSLFPDLRGKLIGVNALQRRVQVTQLKSQSSTFTTVEEPFLLTSEDGRFRPVDLKVGPEGALYVADLYEPRINHVDPRDNWDKATGRLWKITPRDFKATPPRDFTRLSTKELLETLRSENRTAREIAIRVLGWRREARETLQQWVRTEDDRTATAAFLALHQAGLRDEPVTLAALAREKSPALRRWAVRLIGDERKATDAQAAALLRLAQRDPDARVRSQLASSAKRLPAKVALPVVDALCDRDEDAKDPHVPMLIWWAIEAHAETSREDLLALMREGKKRARAIVQSTILERLMQRWIMAGGRENLLAAATLLRESGEDASRLLSGIEKGFAGRTADELPRELRDAILACWERGIPTGRRTLGLRFNHRPAVVEALQLVADARGDRAARLAILRVLGEVDVPAAVPVLLKLLENAPELRADTLAALGRSADPAIAKRVIALGLHRTPAGLDLLAGRATSAKLLLAEIEAKRLDARAVPLDVVRKLALHAELIEMVMRHFGRVRGASAKEKQTEMVRYGNLLKSGKGDAKAGAAVYENACGKCHKLFGVGGSVGPELTGYERGNVIYWLENIVDPSAVIREEYLSFVVRTTNGQTLTGILSGQDKTTVTLRDAEGRETKLSRKRIEDLRASNTSIMPEGQLKALSDQQIRDLFAYLMSSKKP
jgi:putative heme-binding domain-containing protein